MQPDVNLNDSWLDRPFLGRIRWNIETALWIVLLVLAIFSRFYILGARVMSHDENSHVYYSWRFFKGEGFAHDPMMHGPLQFHLLAASYFMFGDNDFTARVPAALFSVATVMFMICYRRYFGAVGALIAGFLMLISPYILFYGRYARNEAFIGLFGVITIWSILRYLDTGKPIYLYTLTAVTVLHFTVKETSFIYTAQALIFLACYFIYRLSKMPWKEPGLRNRFLLGLMLVLIIIGAVGIYTVFNHEPLNINSTITAAPAVPGQDLIPPQPSNQPVHLIIAFILIAIVLLISLYFLIKGFGVEALRSERSFGLLIVLGTMVLPQLSAFPLRLIGKNIPTNVTDVMAMTPADFGWVAAFLVPLLLISMVVGFVWNWKLWLINAGIWYAVFTVFYTSLFTNGAGFFTGIVGSLGYWLEQQGVQRGSQPAYYYVLIQMPVYEYLPALGTLLAFFVYFWEKLNPNIAQRKAFTETDAGQLRLPIEHEPYFEQDKNLEGIDLEKAPAESAPVFPLLGFWAVTSLIAYSIAGEKMPWLTFHITLPAILCTAWGLGKIADIVDWSSFKERKGWLLIVLIPLMLISGFESLHALLGDNPPFQGKELAQLQATSQFLISFLFTLFCGIGVIYVSRSLANMRFKRIFILVVFSLLAVLTIHTSVQANYYNYDQANELLVYAHSAPGVKIALDQIEEISRRTTDGLAIQIAYDNETSYPYWWYLRNYSNAQYYGANPSRALRDSAIILVGDANFGKIEPVVANLYNRFDYIRLWWPNQDYYDLTWTRIKDAITNPQMREAIFQIWLNRDYTEYGKALNRDMSLPNWSPAARMRLYIRKDVMEKLWNYGSVPAPVETTSDPFEGKHIALPANAIFGAPGGENGQFLHPRDVAIAPDGSLYVADTDNNRIQHLSSDGSVLQVWGSFADATIGAAPGGTFNQPWGVAVAPDGTVYVADTWNHRIQRFTASGEFIQTWGYFGQAEQPEAFWGPRGLAVDSAGRVFLTDTGNKRVVVFSADGEFITQFGEAGMGVGQLDEPVGIAVDDAGLVYVADTWNQRIQVFQPNDQGYYNPLRYWDLQAWYGQSLDNKPYLSVSHDGRLFVSDPEGYRILEYSITGEALRSWGDYGVDSTQFGMPTGLSTAPDGSIWVVDTANSRIMRFSPGDLP